MGDRETARRRWAVGSLALYALIVAVVLLSPISYGAIVNGISEWLDRALGIAWFGSGWIEFIANILMFVPLGFLLTLLFRHHWYGVALALALSAAAEVAQSVIPSRETSLRDVLANTLGAAVGAALAWLLVLRRDRKAAASGPDSH